jgi:hypothetical protein
MPEITEKYTFLIYWLMGCVSTIFIHRFGTPKLIPFCLHIQACCLKTCFYCAGYLYKRYANKKPTNFPAWRFFVGKTEKRKLHHFDSKFIDFKLELHDFELELTNLKLKLHDFELELTDLELKLHDLNLK